MSQISNLFLSIGKPVKDEYGRPVGKVICFATTPSGKIDAAFLELSDGRFTKQPMDNLMFNGAEVTFMSKIKSKANVFCDQIPFIWRKDQALKDLVEKRKISSEVYQELHSNFGSVLEQLRKDAQILVDEAAVEIDRCDSELTALSYGVVHLELEHEIGKISEDNYKNAFMLLQENLKRAKAEKSDLEQIKGKLSNILLGDATLPEPPQPKPPVLVEPEPVSDTTTTELPEPPVVVYVKEVGKAGI